jgi:hypothetical protein
MEEKWRGATFAVEEARLGVRNKDGEEKMARLRIRETRPRESRRRYIRDGDVFAGTNRLVRHLQEHGPGGSLRWKFV